MENFELRGYKTSVLGLLAIFGEGASLTENIDKVLTQAFVEELQLHWIRKNPI